MKLAAKRQIAKLWRGLRPDCSAQRGIVVLYHSLGTSPSHISREQFREQMAWLAANTQVVDIDTIASNDWPDSPTGITSAITFDDGYIGVYESGLPILREFNCPATVYVSTDTIDLEENRPQSNDRLLNWMQLRELSENGIRVGSHMMSHTDLTSLDGCEASSQLKGSKAMIEDIIGQECTSFAYPWGRHSDSAVEAVRNAGYRNAAVAVHQTTKRMDVHPFRIPRADIQKPYTLEDFKSIVRGEWDYLGYYQQLRSKRRY